MGTTTRAMSAQAEAKSKSQERIQVPVMDDRAASAVRFDELAHMGHPMGHPMEMGHPMDYGMHHGHHAGVGYNYGFMPGPAPPPVWQNQYMEMNGFKGPMPNWQPASASSHFPAGYGSDGYVSRYNREGVGKGAAISVARRDYHFMADMDPVLLQARTGLACDLRVQGALRIWPQLNADQLSPKSCLLTLDRPPGPQACLGLQACLGPQALLGWQEANCSNELNHVISSFHDSTNVSI